MTMTVGSNAISGISDPDETFKKTVSDELFNSLLLLRRKDLEKFNIVTDRYFGNNKPPIITNSDGKIIHLKYSY